FHGLPATGRCTAALHDALPIFEETFRGFSHQHDGESPQEVQGGDDDPAHKALPDRVGARDAQEEFLQSRRLTPTACSAPWSAILDITHILPPNRHSPACPGRRT